MKEKLGILACVGVIALVIYAAWLFRNVDRQAVVALNNTVQKLSSSLGTPETPTDNSEQYILYGGMLLLFGSTLYVLFKK